MFSAIMTLCVLGEPKGRSVLPSQLMSCSYQSRHRSISVKFQSNDGRKTKLFFLWQRCPLLLQEYTCRPDEALWPPSGRVVYCYRNPESVKAWICEYSRAIGMLLYALGGRNNVALHQTEQCIASPTYSSSFCTLYIPEIVMQHSFR